MTRALDGVAGPGQVWASLSPIARHLRASAGQLSMAVAHFAVSLLALHTLPAGDFGFLAFLLIVVQLLCGLSNALIGTPVSVLANRDGWDVSRAALYFRLNLVIGIGAFALVGLITLANGPAIAALIWAGFALLGVTRWFARSYHFATHRSAMAVRSDIAYSLTLLLLAPLAALASPSSGTLGTAFLLSSIAGILFLGPDILRLQVRSATSTDLAGYGETWRNQSRWAIVGVVASEAVSNAHAWLTTLIAGPASYAPIAAISLLFRPVGVLDTALTQLERPALALAVTQRDQNRVDRIMRQFNRSLLAAWAASLAIGIGILGFAPAVIAAAPVEGATIGLYTALACVALTSAWRAPVAALLQARGRFASIAAIAVWAGGISILVALTLLLVLPAWTSVVGILIGQVILTLWLRKALKQGNAHA